MKDSKINAKQYFLYIGGVYLVAALIGLLIVATDSGPPKPGFWPILAYCVAKALVLMTPGIRFSRWIREPDKLRKAVQANGVLSGLLLSSVLAAGGGFNQGVMGDLFLTSLGLGFVNAAVREQEEEDQERK